MKDTRKIRIGKYVFDYADKAPFVPSGKSLQGVLEIDPAAQTIRCHECGDWFLALGVHLRGHGLSVRDYKIKHGLCFRTSLFGRDLPLRVPMQARAVDPGRRLVKYREDVAAGIRPARVERERYVERNNIKGICPAQLLDRLRALTTDLGRQPTVEEMASNGLGYATLVKRFGSIKNAMLKAGCGHISFRTKGKNIGTPTKEAVLQSLREFTRDYRRAPRGDDFRLGLLPKRHFFVRTFGSMAAALSSIGETKPKFCTYSDSELLQAVIDYATASGQAPTRWDYATDALRIPYETYRRRFGSVDSIIRRSALLATGNAKKVLESRVSELVLAKSKREAVCP